MTSDRDTRYFTEDPQERPVRIQQADQDRTIAAMHQLERALSAAAPLRQQAWRDDVISALAILDEATAEQDQNAGRPDSLLSDIKHNQPRLSPRVRRLRTNYGRIRDSITDLQLELNDQTGHTDHPVDYADLRQRIAWTLTTLRHQQARESDLIYEAYYDAFNQDLTADT